MKKEQYTEQIKRLPKTGRQLIGNTDGENIIVYQAYNPDIAAHAVKQQQLGGEQYRFNRMSWIKPGFLWMMHRAGWATKPNQECILAISIPIHHFKVILESATISSYDGNLFATAEEWKTELDNTEVRLQWDPDHDPYGNKQERKAIQLGMKGALLKKFCTEWIIKIEDITAFVKEEYQKILDNNIEALNVPYEAVIPLNDEAVEKRIGIIKK